MRSKPLGASVLMEVPHDIYASLFGFGTTQSDGFSAGPYRRKDCRAGKAFPAAQRYKHYLQATGDPDGPCTPTGNCRISYKMSCRLLLLRRTQAPGVIPEPGASSGDNRLGQGENAAAA
jgi:hypothetical protein